ncbi:hypothetical protein HC031_17415 [Planosporangium thailandense]|uniref:SHOCT domain-containing protein n=1 Tax=Planosporangium thailandense TaxID=765197 RepID=A0ABX0Y225_9ACTN|nr:SHOCT domain-containing protein [Planosporangium thailandense]NJC71483.1 hypothetical protein [Planosporangium thailandense]
MIASDADPRAYAALKPIASTLPYVATGVTAIAAMILLGVAASVWAGQFAGRIVDWVAAGLPLTCNVCGLGQAGTPAFSGIAYVSAFSRDAAGTHTFAQRLPAAYPPAYRYLSAGFVCFAMLALAVVIVLLARPSANRFFRPATQSVAVPVFYYPDASQWLPNTEATQPTAEQQSQLSVLVRRHQRGELTDEEFGAARQRLLGGS